MLAIPAGHHRYQEAGEIGYYPHKPGHPSHPLHSWFGRGMRRVLGHEGMMVGCGCRGQNYLFRQWQTRKVRQLIQRLTGMTTTCWTKTSRGWGGCMTRDPPRCQVAARNVAPVYNG